MTTHTCQVVKMQHDELRQFVNIFCINRGFGVEFLLPELHPSMENRQVYGPDADVLSHVMRTKVHELVLTEFDAKHNMDPFEAGALNKKLRLLSQQQFEAKIFSAITRTRLSSNVADGLVQSITLSRRCFFNKSYLECLKMTEAIKACPDSLMAPAVRRIEQSKKPQQDRPVVVVPLLRTVASTVLDQKRREFLSRPMHDAATARLAAVFLHTCFQKMQKKAKALRAKHQPDMKKVVRVYVCVVRNSLTSTILKIRQTQTQNTNNNAHFVLHINHTHTHTHFTVV